MKLSSFMRYLPRSIPSLITVEEPCSLLAFIVPTAAVFVALSCESCQSLSRFLFSLSGFHRPANRFPLEATNARALDLPQPLLPPDPELKFFNLRSLGFLFPPPPQGCKANPIKLASPPLSCQAPCRLALILSALRNRRRPKFQPAFSEGSHSTEFAQNVSSAKGSSETNSARTGEGFAKLDPIVDEG
jgi:hypothetical protein